MIDYGDYEDLGKTHKYVSIDLSTTKHKNRVLDVLQSTCMFTGDFEYHIKAQWTSAQYHPKMCMSESELIEFSEKLNLLVDQIKSKSQP